MNTSLNLETVDGYSIAATHTKVSSRGIVLWLHGLSVNKDEYLGFFTEGVEYLAELGFDSLRIDFRGHGDSGGSSLDFTVIGQMLDLEAALEYLSCEYDLSKVSLSIVGCSFGAPPALFAAIRYPDKVRKLGLIAPVLSYERTFLKPETEWAQEIFNDSRLADMRRTKRLYISDDFPVSIRLVEEMKIIRPDLVLGDVAEDTLIVHGEADSMVPYAVTKDLVKGLRGIRLISIAGMDHGFTDESDEEGTSEISLSNKKRIYSLIAEHFS